MSDVPTTGQILGPMLDEALTDNGKLRAEVERLREERDRAVETRENANTVSVRVEMENRRLTAEVERLREAARLLISAYMEDADLDAAINALADAAGLHQQGDPSTGEQRPEAGG